MGNKTTERKAFNFYISYFDVYKELKKEDKVAFIDALLNRQFYGIEPTNLKGLSNFAYLSQKHSIDSQVKGFEDKTQTKLTTPTVGGTTGGAEHPCQQEEEEGKGKGQYTVNWEVLISKFNELTGKTARIISEKVKKQVVARLKEGYSKIDILNAIKNCTKDDFHIKNNLKYLTIEFITRQDKLEKFSTVKELPQPKDYEW